MNKIAFSGAFRLLQQNVFPRALEIYATLAQLGERQTEDLKVLSSILRGRIFIYWPYVYSNRLTFSPSC